MVSKWAKACSIISATALFLGFSACGSANTNRSGTAEGITAEDVEKALTDDSKTVELTFVGTLLQCDESIRRSIPKEIPAYQN